MTVTNRYLSASNGFIPAATGQAIAFTNEPARFKLNRYVQNLKSPKPIGVYALLDRDQPARVVTDQEFAWQDGDPRPKGTNNTGTFQWVEFATVRRDYPYTVGQQAIEAAEGWNPKMLFNAIILQQAMTNRTQRVVTLLETTANWPAQTTSDANTLNAGAGKWNTASSDPSSPNYLAIRKSLEAAVLQIILNTNDVVQIEDLILLISPGLAFAMSQTDEINAYLKGSPFALAQVKGATPGQNALFGLPDTYAGVKIEVETAVRVTSRANTANVNDVTGGGGTRQFIKSNSSAELISRKGGIRGNFGSPSFSTVQCYFYQYELAVEAFSDAKNKLEECHLVEQFKEVLAAPIAGYHITNTM